MDGEWMLNGIVLQCEVLMEGANGIQRSDSIEEDSVQRS